MSVPLRLHVQAIDVVETRRLIVAVALSMVTQPPSISSLRLVANMHTSKLEMAGLLARLWQVTVKGK